MVKLGFEHVIVLTSCILYLTLYQIGNIFQIGYTSPTPILDFNLVLFTPFFAHGGKKETNDKGMKSGKYLK